MLLAARAAVLAVVPVRRALYWPVLADFHAGVAIMTRASDTSHPSGLASGISALHAKWGWIVALGVVYLVAGFVALGSVVMATVASVIVVGAMMIVAGAAEIIGAFQMKSWGKFVIWALLGVLYVIAGFLTFENPLFAAVLLTLFLAHRCSPPAPSGCFSLSA
jgi:hypothetical protein